MTETSAAPALGFSLSFDLGAGRSLVLQTHLPNDANGKELADMLDKMGDAGDRMKARYDIVTEQNNIAVHHRQIENMTKDLAKIDARTDRDDDEAKAALAALAEQKDRVNASASTNFYASGKSGTYKPSPQTEQALRAVDADVENIKKVIANRVKEREEAHAQVADSQEKARDEIAACEARIERAKAKLEIKD